MAANDRPDGLAELPADFERWPRDRQARHIAESRYRGPLIEEVLHLAEFGDIDPDQIGSWSTVTKDMLGTIVAALRVRGQSPGDTYQPPGKPVNWDEWPLQARGEYIADRHRRGELAAKALRLSGHETDRLDDDEKLTTRMLAIVYCALRGYQFNATEGDTGDR